MPFIGPQSQSQDNFETFSDNFEMTLETVVQKKVTLMLNPLTDIVTIKRPDILEFLCLATATFKFTVLLNNMYRKKKKKKKHT